MIKVKHKTATREPLPDFLNGLAPESLADLSWTDPALGVQDCAWWPEQRAEPVFDPDTHRLGAETLIVDADNTLVHVSYEVVALTADEIAARQAAQAKARRDELKVQRQAAVDAIQVTTSAGHTFDGDEVSQTRMARAIIALQATGTPSVTWVLADNSVIEATAAELTEALALAGAAQAALWVIA